MMLERRTPRDCRARGRAALMPESGPAFERNRPPRPEAALPRNAAKRKKGELIPTAPGAAFARRFEPGEASRRQPRLGRCIAHDAPEGRPEGARRLSNACAPGGAGTHDRNAVRRRAARRGRDLALAIARDAPWRLVRSGRRKWMRRCGAGGGRKWSGPTYETLGADFTRRTKRRAGKQRGSLKLSAGECGTLELRIEPEVALPDEPELRPGDELRKSAGMTSASLIAGRIGAARRSAACYPIMTAPSPAVAPALEWAAIGLARLGARRAAAASVWLQHSPKLRLSRARLANW